MDNASTAAGATALIWDCHTAANQLWTTWAGGEIRVFGDKCLDAYNQGTANGTRVITWPCNGQDNQKWTVGSDGSIRNVHAGLCLDVDRAGTANGTAAGPVDLQRPGRPEVDPRVKDVAHRQAAHPPASIPRRPR